MLKSASITRTVLVLILAGMAATAYLAARSMPLGLAAGALFAFALALWLRQRLRKEARDLSARGFAGSDEFRPVAEAQRAHEEQQAASIRSLTDKQLQLEALLEGMQDGVLGVDAGRRVEWTNAELGRILDRHGLGTAVRLGRSLAHTLRDPALHEALDRALEQRTAANIRTGTLLPGRIFDVNAAPLPNGGAVLVLRDVTESEAMERAQREFVANVSHELRTPLTSVRGYTETLLDSDLVAPEAEPWLEIVLKNVERMSRLTEDLLTLARIEQPGRKPLREAVPVSLLIETAVRTFDGQDSAEHVEVTERVTTDAEVVVDEIGMLQVLGNLLENAARYGRSADGRTRVDISAEETNFGTVLLRVMDHGSGIAIEHQARIFERFYRVDRARSRDTGGTGLGLAIARHLVQENGGTISLESRYGEGATFVVELPRALAELEKAAEGAEADVGVAVDGADAVGS